MPRLLITCMFGILFFPGCQCMKGEFNVRGGRCLGKTSAECQTLYGPLEFSVGAAPLDLLDNISIDSDARQVTISNAPSGVLVSLQLLHKGDSLLTLECSNLPQTVMVRKGWIYFNLGVQDEPGEMTLQCVGDKKAFTLKIAYENSNTHVVSSDVDQPVEVYNPQVSADGKWLIFGTTGMHVSASKQIVGYNLEARTLHTISSQNGEHARAGDGNSVGFVIAPDSSYVAFSSDAPNLGATNQIKQVMTKSLIDLSAPPVLISKNAAGTLANAPCGDVAISPDGTKIAFASTAGNLGADTDQARIFVKNTAAPLIAPVLVSVGSDGVTQQQAYSPKFASNSKIYYLNNATQKLERKNLNNLATAAEVISVGADGITAASSLPEYYSVSPDGSKVLITSTASELGVTNGKNQCIVKNTINLATTPTIVSVASDGSTLANESCLWAEFESDSSNVRFVTQASNFGRTPNLEKFSIYRKRYDAQAASPTFLLEMDVPSVGNLVGDLVQTRYPNLGYVVSPSTVDSHEKIAILKLNADAQEMILSLPKELAAATGNRFLSSAHWNESTKKLYQVITPSTASQNAFTNYATSVVYAGDADGLRPLTKIQSVRGGTMMFSEDSRWMYYLRESDGGSTDGMLYRSDLLNAGDPQLVSVLADGVTKASGRIAEYAINAAGTAVLMVTESTNMGANGTIYQCVYKSLTDGLNSAPVVISTAAGGVTVGDGNCTTARFSKDGTVVYFLSGSNNFGVSNVQVFRKRLDALHLAPTVVTVAGDGATQANSNVEYFWMSKFDDSMFFITPATNLASFSSDYSMHVFHKNLINLSDSPRALTGKTIVGDHSSKKLAPLFASIYSPSANLIATSPDSSQFYLAVGKGSGWSTDPYDPMYVQGFLANADNLGDDATSLEIVRSGETSTFIPALFYGLGSIWNVVLTEFSFIDSDRLLIRGVAPALGGSAFAPTLSIYKIP